MHAPTGPDPLRPPASASRRRPRSRRVRGSEAPSVLAVRFAWFPPWRVAPPTFRAYGPGSVASECQLSRTGVSRGSDPKIHARTSETARRTDIGSPRRNPSPGGLHRLFVRRDRLESSVVLLYLHHGGVRDGGLGELRAQRLVAGDHVDIALLVERTSHPGFHRVVPTSFLQAHGALDDLGAYDGASKGLAAIVEHANHVAGLDVAGGGVVGVDEERLAVYHLVEVTDPGVVHLGVDAVEVV